MLLYVKNLTLREIGDILGVSESRVCQIHSQLKRTLKQQLSEDAVAVLDDGLVVRGSGDRLKIRGEHPKTRS